MREQVPAGERVSLRRWREDDWQTVLEAFAEPEMGRQTDVPIDSPGAARTWLSRRMEQWADGTGYSFAVTDATGAVGGNVSVSSVNRRHSTGWVSYWTIPSARGGGLATQACRALAGWAFEDAGLFRLELGHRVDNPASCRVAIRAGFLVEGVERQKLAYGDLRYDVELHARLASDPVPEGRHPVHT